MSTPTSVAPAPKDEELVWEKFETAGGKTFSVGRPAGESTKPAFSIAASGVKFNLPVDWPAKENDVAGQWKNTPADFANVSRITRYNLYFNDGGFWDWRLDFTNEDTYDYYFRDEEGDVYTVRTWSKGDHYVRFDSKKPKIVNVSGD